MYRKNFKQKSSDTREHLSDLHDNSTLIKIISGSDEKNTLYAKIVIFFLAYSSLISGVGAVLYVIGNMVNIDVTSIITSNFARVLLNIFIFVCGMITIGEWMFLDTMYDLAEQQFNNLYK
jgi:hypothetical protein